MVLGLAACVIATVAAAAPLGFPVGVVERFERGDRFETTLTFPSPVKSPWPANDLVWAHLIVPKTADFKKARAVLVLPVMAAPNVWIESKFVDRFVRDGLVVLWLEMPTQFHRRPDPSEPSGQVFLARTPKRLAANYRQSVADARRALDILSARPEVDAGKIAIFGISLGAIVGSAVYSADPRPDFAVFLLGGADFPTLLVNSSLSGPFARKMGISPGDLRSVWQGLDPLESKTRNSGKPVLLVNASWDTVIPKANALKLKEAFPDARQVWVPFGHYTAILHLLWLPRWVSGLIKEKDGLVSK